MCNECRDICYLTSESLDNLTDFVFKCRNCNMTNRITLEDEESKK
jgi:hypothetical protein